MTTPSYSEVFDNNTAFITSAAYSSGSKTLSIVFSSELNGVQAAAAVLQSLNNYFADKADDQTLNVVSSSPSRNTTSRNSVAKDSISISFQIYTPPASFAFDPSTI